MRRRLKSFKHAADGISIGLKDQFNLRFHFLAAILAISLAIYYQISRLEWLILILTIGLVVATELLNTAVEEIVNSFTADVHPAAKKAKDVAAAAVLISAVIALVIGIIIFGPYLTNQSIRPIA